MGKDMCERCEDILTRSKLNYVNIYVPSNQINYNDSYDFNVGNKIFNYGIFCDDCMYELKMIGGNYCYEQDYDSYCDPTEEVMLNMETSLKSLYNTLYCSVGGLYYCKEYLCKNYPHMKKYFRKNSGHIISTIGSMWTQISAEFRKEFFDIVKIEREKNEYKTLGHHYSSYECIPALKKMDIRCLDHILVSLKTSNIIRENHKINHGEYPHFGAGMYDYVRSDSYHENLCVMLSKSEYDRYIEL